MLFTSDSRYLVDGMSTWVHAWKRQGWTRKGGAVENLELWHQACDAAALHSVEWLWVRGHRGHPQNEYANHLATRAAAEQTHSDGFVESEFDGWLEKEREKGRTREPEPFPS